MENSKPAPRLEPKLALITPSASPPSRSFFPQPYRIPDQASPTKRPRLSSAPRQSQPRASSSSASSVADAADLHKAREESTMRMLDVWAGLAEQYNLPPDEDDIIDIRTGKVVKDRGVLRGSRILNFGAFAHAAAEDAEDEAEEDNDEEEVDELDSFAHPGMPDIDLGVDERRVPPVTEMDPRDAEDLREFLEAERKRKEIYGSEVDETEGSVYESQGEEVDADNSRLSESTDASPLDDPDPEGDEENDVSHPLDDDQTPHQHADPVYVDSGSDDELDNWDLDEASAVYCVAKKEDSDSEIEIFDSSAKDTSLSPEIPLIPLATTSRANSKRPSFSAQRQLQTPPQSQTSSIPSATPDDYIVQLPPDSSSPPRSSSPVSSHYDSSPIKPQEINQHSRKPRSERKRTANLVDVTPPIPRLDLTKLSKESTRPKPKARAPPHALEASGSGPAFLPKATPASQVTGTKVSLEARKSNVEVVIEQRPPFRPTKTSTTPDEGKESEPSSKKAENQVKPGTSAKAKGKQKATSGDQRIQSFTEVIDGDNFITTPSSPTSTRKTTPHSPKSRSRRPSASNSALPQDRTDHLPERAIQTSRKPGYGELLVTESASTAGTKRKRVVSATETDMDTNKAPPPESGTTQPRSRNASTSRVRHHSNDSGFQEPERVRALEVKPKDRRKHTPKPRSRSSDYEAGGNSAQEEYEEYPRRHFSRAPSHFGDHSYYPYPQPAYPPPHHHDQQPHMYAPIPDPRAQFIITQAMQQLSALVGGAWTPPHAQPPSGMSIRGSTPYTPSHYRHYRPDTPGSMYSTPTHHAHPYPYSYNPDMSNATMPPDSPDMRSSSPLVADANSSSGGVRQKSILRGQSRGRRVSFRIEEDIVDTMDMPVSSDGRSNTEGGSRERAQNRRGDSRSREHASHTQTRRKGNEKARREMSESHSEAEPEEPSRGRSSVRSHTPGPPGHAQDARPNAQGAPAANRGRSRAVPARN